MNLLTSAGRRAAVASFALVATALVAPTVASGGAAVAATDGASAADRPTLELHAPSGGVYYGETIPVSGTAPGPGVRTVELQGREGRRGAWVSMWAHGVPSPTEPDGTWTDSLKFMGPTEGSWYAFRLVAFADREAGLERSVSSLRWAYLRRENVSLDIDPQTATEGGSVTLSASFAPVRPGRRVLFQEHTDNGWTVVGEPTVQSEDGTAELVLGDLQEGSRKLRVKTGGGPGDHAAVSRRRTLTVQPSPGR